MGLLISLAARIITILRIVIPVILGSMGTTTILATAFRMIYHPLQGDFLSTVTWMAKPLAVAFILLALPYLISKTLTKFQKFIIVTLVFLISVMSLYSMVSGMDWTASLQAQSPGVMGPPINMLKQITAMLQGVTGV